MIFQKRFNIVIACCVLIGLVFTFTHRSYAGSFQIYIIDVGQADATLLVSPSGKTLLVDSGNNGHGPRIRSVMKDAGVTRINYFVCTHYHADNYGGIDELVNSGVSIDHVYDRGDKAFLPGQKLESKTFQDYNKTVGNRALHLARGSTIPLDPEVFITCIASGGLVLGEDSNQHGETENEMSIALLIQYGAFKYFIGGGIGKTTEDRINQLNILTNVDMYQSNLKGSLTAGTIKIEVDGAADTYTMAFRDKLYFFQTKDRVIPESEIVIHSVLPNPIGDDRYYELVSLKNKGNVPVSMTDWKLKNKKGRIWPLTGFGTIHSGQTVTIERNRMPMSLDNRSDKITLLGPRNEIIDTYSYDSTEEGVLIATGH
jgi:beta-lactamase superfamily II metal-dependent hydrolase